MSLAPDPVLHSQVDRDVALVTDAPGIEKAAVTQTQRTPESVIRT